MKRASRRFVSLLNVGRCISCGRPRGPVHARSPLFLPSPMLTAARCTLLAALRAAPCLCARAYAGAPATAAARPPAAAAAVVPRYTSHGFAADAAVDDDAASGPSISVALVDGATGSHRGSTSLPSDIFAAPIRTDILHRVIRWQQAKARAGTEAAKNRAAVRGGGRKPWKQKGTGRARAGSIRSPLWVGGGKAHPPTPRSFEHGCNRRVRRAALAAALSARASEGRLLIVEGRLGGGDGKTVSWIFVVWSCGGGGGREREMERG